MIASASTPIVLTPLCTWLMASRVIAGSSGLLDKERVADQPDVHDHEGQEDRQQRKHRFLDPPQIDPDHQHDHHRQTQNFSRSQLVGMKLKIASAPLAIEIAMVST